MKSKEADIIFKSSQLDFTDQGKAKDGRFQGQSHTTKLNQNWKSEYLFKEINTSEQLEFQQKVHKQDKFRSNRTNIQEYTES